MAHHAPLSHPSRDTDRNGVAGLTQVPAGKVELEAELVLPGDARGLVLFAQGSCGSSRKSPRDQRVAGALHRRGLGTLLFDALTPAERRQDAFDERLRFDVGLLARRLARITEWAQGQAFGTLPIGYFGASAGAAAAIVAATEQPSAVQAVVCSSGRPDLAGSALRRLRAPVLSIVGSEDPITLRMNELALGQVRGLARLEVVPGAGHLFEDPGVLDIVGELAGGWFGEHLVPPAGPRATP
jgi:putative phosphoribosyl transferase